VALRVLIGPDGPEGEPDDHRLAELYAVPRAPWLRVNFVSTVDGAATGEDGRSGSINDAIDRRVFDLLRRLADVVVVGAGTATIERYRPVDRPIAVVSRRGVVPPLLAGAGDGSVLLVTCAEAPGLEDARAGLGGDQVLVLGEDAVDLRRLGPALAERGLPRQLCEGGPHLFRDLLAADAVDELCATVVPRLVAGPHPRITAGPPVDVDLRLDLLLEHAGTLLGRWRRT